MQRPSYWLLADPERNFQFSRGWLEDDPPPERIRPAGQGQGAVVKADQVGEAEFTAAERARQAAEALFRRDVAEARL